MIALPRTRLRKKTSSLRQAATSEKNLLELLLDNLRPLSKISFCDERVVEVRFELANQLHRFHGGPVAGRGSLATTNEQDPGGSIGGQVLRAERVACLPGETFSPATRRCVMRRAVREGFLVGSADIRGDFAWGAATVGIESRRPRSWPGCPPHAFALEIRALGREETHACRTGFAGSGEGSSASTSIGIAGGAVSETGQWACSKR